MFRRKKPKPNNKWASCINLAQTISNPKIEQTNLYKMKLLSKSTVSLKETKKKSIQEQMRIDEKNIKDYLLGKKPMMF